MGHWKHKKLGKYDTYPDGVVDQDAFAKVLESRGAVEVTPMEAYTTIFRLGEGYIQKAGEYSDGTTPIKGNPIAYYKEHKDDKTGHFRIMREDRFEDDLAVLQKADFAVLNGVTYYGRKNLAAHQDRCFALIFDIDAILDVTIGRVFDLSAANFMPLPQFVALSGHGMHLYYVLEDPLPLYPATKLRLKALKYELTRKIWRDRLSCDEHVQTQGINQGFRPLGAKTKIRGKRVRVFETNPHPVTIQQLNSYVSEESRVAPGLAYKSLYTLDEAREMWPDWYQKRVVEGVPRGYYHVNRALYDWWLRQVRDENVVSYHHRYFCIMALYIFAAKCDVAKDEVDRDAAALVPLLDTVDDDPFTMDDVRSAADCYDERFRTFPKKDLERITDVVFPANRHNGRKQSDHLKIARLACDLAHPDGSWRNADGAPTKQEKVIVYAASHPDATPTQAARDLGVSRPTVYKWWPKKGEKEKQK